MRGLGAFRRQGCVVELARRDRIEAEFELIIPTECEARFVQRVVEILRVGIVFGEAREFPFELLLRPRVAFNVAT
jgi:hypothetical protein